LQKKHGCKIRQGRLSKIVVGRFAAFSSQKDPAGGPLFVIPYCIYYFILKTYRMETNKNTQAADAEKQNWKDKAEDKLQDLKAKAAEYADKAEDKFEELKDKAEDKFDELKEKAEDVVDELKEKASGLWDKVKDKFDGDDEEKAKQNPGN
jgi:hypothetical protein